MTRNQAFKLGLKGSVTWMLLVFGIIAALAVGTPAVGQTMKIGVVAFLTGGAGGPFGIPARNGAEMIINAINNGKVPAPYNTKGIGGRQVEGIFIDESGGTTKQVEEFRNLVQRQNVDAVTGYISSGSCLGIAPVAEELKMLTVFNICGTPRIFEAGSYKYVFRTTPHSTMDNVAAAHYVRAKLSKIRRMAAINQNYSWGQDSWRDFELSMKMFLPKVKTTTVQFPKIFSGKYGAEISKLQRSRAQLIHTSFWGGDLESFVNQARSRGLHKKAVLALTAGENSMYRLGGRIPNGTIIGARGPYGLYAENTELNKWFRAAYEGLYGSPPVYPSYMAAQAIIAMKIAYDKAAAEAGQFPTREQAIAKLENLKFEAFGTTIDMKAGKGHQGITGTAYGVYKFDTKTGTGTIKNIRRFAADCVNPPEGVSSEDWIKGGLKGAKCK